MSLSNCFKKLFLKGKFLLLDITKPTQSVHGMIGEFRALPVVKSGDRTKRPLWPVMQGLRFKVSWSVPHTCKTTNCFFKVTLGTLTLSLTW